MTGKVLRLAPVPGASDPALLLRLVALVGQGVRQAEALSAELSATLMATRSTADAAQWLGLLEPGVELVLTPRGREIAFADPRRRRRLLGHALWHHPVVGALLAGRRDLPGLDTITQFIQAEQPALPLAVATRLAEGLRGLLAPAMEHRPSRSAPRGDQLALPLRAPPHAPAPLPEVEQAGAGSPALYAVLLRALLDHGELSLGAVRALLDEVGAAAVPLAGPVELALARGDATREGDALVVTAGGAARRALARDGTTVALSDPVYRAWLAARVAGEAPAPVDARRFAAWDALVLGEGADDPATALARALGGRALASLPAAGDAGPPIAATAAPFVEVLDTPGLALCFPSTLGGVALGLRELNAALRTTTPDRPGALSARSRVHGGLVAPGERPPRSIPDLVTLRLRALSTAPAFSLLGALLLLDRRLGRKLRIQLGHDEPSVRWGRLPLGPLIDVLASFAVSQGWVVSRPPPGAGQLRGADLVAAASTLGLIERTGSRIVLDELLFMRLQDDPEAGLIGDQLQPLADRLHRWLDGVGRLGALAATDLGTEDDTTVGPPPGAPRTDLRQQPLLDEEG